MQAFDYVLVFTTIGLGILYFLLLRRIKAQERSLIKIRATIQRVLLEKVVVPEVTETELFKESLSNLSKRIFQILKRTYNLKATTLSELLEEVRTIPIEDKELKKKLIDFIDSIITLEYSGRTPTQRERMKIKTQAIELIKRMGLLRVAREESK